MRYFYGLLFLFTIITSQNCARNEDTFSQYAPPRAAVNVNPGAGAVFADHDRQIFVRRQPTVACADGSMNESLILFHGVDPILIRNDCVDLSVSQQQVVEVVFDQNRDDYLIFNGRTFYSQPDQDEILATIPMPPPGPSVCLGSGKNPASPFPTIDYRRCNAEVDVWQQILVRKCCSGSVQITDLQTFTDVLCPDGRFEGQAVCN